MKTLTIIPSRLSASRLPGKPLLKINDLSIISHVFKRAQEANIGDVVVAAEDEEIVDDVIKNGGRAILTGKNHKTGTDRIYEAMQKLEIKNIDLIMNLQGDEPEINIEDIISLNKVSDLVFRFPIIMPSPINSFLFPKLDDTESPPPHPEDPTHTYPARAVLFGWLMKRPQKAFPCKNEYSRVQ